MLTTGGQPQARCTGCRWPGTRESTCAASAFGPNGSRRRCCPCRSPPGVATQEHRLRPSRRHDVKPRTTAPIAAVPVCGLLHESVPVQPSPFRREVGGYWASCGDLLHRREAGPPRTKSGPGTGETGRIHAQHVMPTGTPGTRVHARMSDRPIWGSRATGFKFLSPRADGPAAAGRSALALLGFAGRPSSRV